MSAEAAYMFRHALLRDAAYQLQMPGDRVRLHGAAIEAIEAVLGGRPPAPKPLATVEKVSRGSHPIDPFARELAVHARLAGHGVERHAITLKQAGRIAEAETEFRRSLEILRDAGERRAEGSMLGSLANLLSDAGRLDEADRAFRQALATLREIGERRFEGVVLGNFSLVHEKSGRPEEAERSLREALAIHHETRNRRFQGTHRCDLAILLVGRGRVDEARAAWTEGLAILRELGSAPDIAHKRKDLAAACAAAGIEAIDA